MSNYSDSFQINNQNHPWNKAFEIISDGSTILDVGCSSGNFGEALIKYKKCIVDGIEPDAEDAKKAKAKLRYVFNGSIEDAKKTKIKKQKYDYIVFLDVIEHLYKPSEILKDIKSLLGNNGGIVFSIPNMEHISVRLKLFEGKFGYGETGLLDNTHLHFYSKKEIIYLFSKSGYIINKLFFTEAKYSTDLIKAELNKLGITKFNSNLIENLTKPESYIFQYIGLASPGELKNSGREKYFPDPQKTIQNWYEKREKYLLKEIKKLKEENQNKPTQSLNSDIEIIYNTRISKYLKVYILKKLNIIKNFISKE